MDYYTVESDTCIYTSHATLSAARAAAIDHAATYGEIMHIWRRNEAIERRERHCAMVAPSGAIMSGEW